MAISQLQNRPNCGCFIPAMTVFIERLWRSLKYELIYPGDFATGLDLFPALEDYFHFYNHQRPHQALGYHTPADLFPHRSKRKRSS
jgi:putative transposase